MREPAPVSGPQTGPPCASFQPPQSRETIRSDSKHSQGLDQPCSQVSWRSTPLGGHVSVRTTRLPRLRRRNSAAGHFSLAVSGALAHFSSTKDGGTVIFPKRLELPLSGTVIHRYFASLTLWPASMLRMLHPDCPKSLPRYGHSSLSPKLPLKRHAPCGRLCLRSFHKRFMANIWETGL